MCRFIETIKIYDGKIFNINFHNKRFNKTRLDFYKLKDELNLIDFIEIPEGYKKDLVKLRIIYDKNIYKMEFFHYIRKNIKSLKIILCDDINYNYKYENREKINDLFNQKETCDDIIIVQNNLITDSSFSNLVFDDGNNLITPKTCLLKGIKRGLLLNESKIKEKEITLNDLNNFKKVYLINAMIDLFECEINIKSIKK